MPYFEDDLENKKNLKHNSLYAVLGVLKSGRFKIRRIKLSFGELFAQSLGRATGSLIRARNLIPTALDSLKKSLGLFFLFSP